MRFHSLSLRAALLALPIALMAQDAKPPVSLTRQIKANEGEIQKLMDAMDAKAALAKAEAMIPAVKPAFAKASPREGLTSSQEYNSLMAIYGHAARAAIAAGEWEKGKGYLEMAQTIARENSTETETVIAPLVDTWKKAMEGSKKALDEGAERRKALEANEKRTPADQQDLDNFKVHDNNMKNGPEAIKGLQGTLDGLKSDVAGYDPAITALTAKIKSEQEQMLKFKGDKAAYVKAVLANKANLQGIAKPVDKVSWLNRLMVLDPSGSLAQKQLDIVLGKAPAEPEKRKAAKPKKKA